MSIRILLKTTDSISCFLLRITAGCVVFTHGLQKMFGLFGGHGPAETMKSFHEWFGIPPSVTFLVILSDSIGSVLLMLGLMTRISAAAISVVMVGAILIVHGHWGFYMNWYGEPRGEGIEFHLLMLAITIVLVREGGGRWSVDGYLETRIKGR